MTSDGAILIIGAKPHGLQAALNLARFGRKVTLIESGSEIERSPRNWSDKAKRWSKYLLAQVSYHPLIEIWTETTVVHTNEASEGIKVEWIQRPQWILPRLCVDCQRCLSECPVELSNRRKPIFQLTAPNTLAIDKRRKAPCRLACPLDMNVQGYVALIAQGRFGEAYQLILDTNPLPGVCGRICHRPCEEACRRQEIDEPITICSLKRFATAKARKERKAQGHHVEVSGPQGLRVAIIGSGPAGLTAAHDLAKAGFRPTLIEADDAPGGLLRQGIAPYRLPQEILEEEVEEILALGVDLRINTPVHSQEGLEKLKAEGFRTILLTTGASKDRWLKIKGEDLKGIYGCVAFLNRLWKGQKPESLGKVVVIGGGNAAVEAARASIRLGCPVTILYRRGKKEMPADGHEVEQALEEGVKLRCLTLPIEFEGRGHRLARIRCIKMKLGGIDSSGRPKPIPIDGSDFFINADTAIMSIGQQAELLYGMAGDFEMTRWGTIKVTSNGESNIPGIYAAGDIVSGPSTVVEAMASGRRAAQMIIRALTSVKRTTSEKGPEPSLGEYEPIPKGIPRQRRSPLPHREVNRRKKDYKEVIGPYSTKEALKEASRCLQCGLCSECLRCEASCDLGAIYHDRTSVRRSLLFDRIIVADQRQIAPRLASSRMVRVSSGKGDSFQRVMVDGRVAALKALSHAPFTKTQPISRKALGNGDLRVAIFICSCNGTLNGNGQLDRMIAPLSRTPGVDHVEILISACHPEKGRRIEELIHEKGFNGALIASCACCHLDFVCESCTDQRIRLKHRLFREAGYEQKDISLVNIKETCLLPFKHDGKTGIDLAIKVIRSGLWQLRDHKEGVLSSEKPLTQAVILGATDAGLAAAKCLNEWLTSVSVVEDRRVKKKIEEELRGCGIDLIWPARPVRLDGQPGKLTLIVEKGKTSYPSRKQESPKNLRRKKAKSLLLLNSQSLDDNPCYQKISAGLVILGRDEFKNIPYKRDPFATDYQVGRKKPFGTLETGIPGVYMASWSQARKVTPVAFGEAAASMALEEISNRSDDSGYLVASADTELCRGCGKCADICPEGAAVLQETTRGVASSWIEPWLCTGCGNCLAECPTGAIHMPESEQGYYEKVMDVFFG